VEAAVVEERGMKISLLDFFESLVGPLHVSPSFDWLTCLLAPTFAD